ncbi:SVM family protein [New Jersey aster yellows phytoplasma]|uniref:Sequence-variable mosaic (SVM) signal sequence domain-containing protein n=1 Tax=New Jersey aster yellows phytoplasma TaxID=270520 RepID=A0ABX4K0L3_9MOLU|nr:SVM family protein [New Jersey aster yellows phytoplasma]PEH36335.1 hypothetical protein BBA70_01225 [New Jersey aster yellows phytoplasma]
MFKFKNQFKRITICLFIFLGLFLINCYPVMAINNLNDENSINNEINKLYLEQKELSKKLKKFIFII